MAPWELLACQENTYSKAILPFTASFSNGIILFENSFYVLSVKHSEKAKSINLITQAKLTLTEIKKLLK